MNNPIETAIAELEAARISYKKSTGLFWANEITFDEMDAALDRIYAAKKAVKLAREAVQVDSNPESQHVDQRLYF